MARDLFGAECRVTSDVICKVTVWLWRLFPVLLTAVGTVGNVINVIVLLRKNLRSKPCFILIFLSVSDLIVLWSLLILDGLRFGFGIQLSPEMCVFGHFLKHTFGAISLWIIAIFTIERVLFIAMPHESNRHLTQARTVAVLVGMLCVMFPMFGLTTFLKGEEGLDSYISGGKVGRNTSFQTPATFEEGNMTKNMFPILDDKENASLNGAVTFETPTASFADTSSANNVGNLTTMSALIGSQSSPSPTTTATNGHVIDNSTDDGQPNVSNEHGTTDAFVAQETLSFDNDTNGQDATEEQLVNAENHLFTTSTNKDYDENSNKDYPLSSRNESESIISENQNQEGPNTINGSLNLTKSPFMSIQQCSPFNGKKGTFKYFLQALSPAIGLLIPYAVIVLGNGGLIVYLNRRKQNSDNSDKSQTTLLFIIMAVLMITVTPEVITVILLLTRVQFNITNPWFGFAYAFIESIACFNYTVNFFCYFWKSSIFKDECKSLWKELKNKFIS